MTYQLRDLNGKVVIITGATAGIGAAAARALVEKGCKVVLNARNEERLKSMVAELGANAIYVAGDSSNPDIARKVAKAAIGATLHFAQANAAAMANDKFDDYGISFFPNPTKDTLNVNLGSLPISEYTFSIIDVNGKEVLNTSIKEAKLIESVSVATLVKGIYLGVLQSGSNRITKKIVIE